MTQDKQPLDNLATFFDKSQHADCLWRTLAFSFILILKYGSFNGGLVARGKSILLYFSVLRYFQSTAFRFFPLGKKTSTWILNILTQLTPWNVFQQIWTVKLTFSLSSPPPILKELYVILFISHATLKPLFWHKEFEKSIQAIIRTFTLDLCTRFH